MTELNKNWNCIKCGTECDQTFCGQCGFRIIPKFDQRLIAYTIDFLILSVFSFSIRHINVESIGTYLALRGFWLAFVIIYLVVLLKLWGQTIGKMFMGIKVVCFDGSPLGWSNVGLRYTGEIIIWLSWIITALLKGPMVLLFIFMIVYLGYGFSDTFVALKNDGYRAIHNFISDTIVVNDPQSKQIPENN